MSLNTQQQVLLTHVNNMHQQIQHATHGATDHNSQKLNLAMREMQKRAAMGQDVHENMKQVHNLLKIHEHQAQNNRFAQNSQPPGQRFGQRFGADPAHGQYNPTANMHTGNAPGHSAPTLSHDQVHTFSHNLNKMAALTGHANYFHQ